MPPLVSIEATEVCMPIDNSKVLLATFISHHVTPEMIVITELLSFRHKLLLAGDLNAKHGFWNNVVSNLSVAKLMNLLHRNEFEFLAPECPTHYSPTGNGDVLNIVVHKDLL
jgi:hypothetical protein